MFAAFLAIAWLHVLVWNMFEVSGHAWSRTIFYLDEHIILYGLDAGLNTILEYMLYTEMCLIEQWPMTSGPTVFCFVSGLLQDLPVPM